MNVAILHPGLPQIHIHSGTDAMRGERPGESEKRPGERTLDAQLSGSGEDAEADGGGHGAELLDGVVWVVDADVC